MCFRSTTVVFFLSLVLLPLPVRAAMRHCKDPAIITLEKGVSMVFCTVPAEHGMESFQIAQFEVTQLQYKAVMDDEPWKLWKGKAAKKGEPGIRIGDNLPAVYLSNDEAARFAKALGQLDKSAVYRLPTEDEWENAARGGATTEFYWGDNFKTLGLKHSSYAFCDRADLPSAQDIHACPDEVRQAAEPGYCANQYGLMHILGNVWEWTSTVTMGTAGRVIAGGGWYGSPRYCRASVHSYGNSYYRDIGLGFRPVRIPK